MPRDVVRMQFADGTHIQEWESVTLRDSFTDPTQPFTFVTKPDRSRVGFYRQRLRKGELVGVKVNSAPQFVGLIQTVEQTISPEDGVVFTISGGNPLITPYEGAAVDDPSDYSKELTFHSKSDVAVSEFVLRVFGPYGFTQFDGDDGRQVDLNLGRKRTKKRAKINVSNITHSDAQAHPGEAAYTVVARILTRNGVVLRLNVDGTLSATAPDYEQEPSYTLVCDYGGKHAGDRFFGTITITDTNEGQFSECAVRGQSADRKGDKFTAKPVEVVTAETLFPGFATYRSTAAPFKPVVIQDKQSRDKKEALNTAKLKLGLAAKSAFTVRGTLDGWSSSNHRIWTVNTIARVVIEPAGIDRNMWVSSRTLLQDPDGGQRCEIELIEVGSLVIGDVPN